MIKKTLVISQKELRKVNKFLEKIEKDIQKYKTELEMQYERSDLDHATTQAISP